MTDEGAIKTTDLETSMSLVKATLESTADGILVIDRQDKIISSNEKFRKMWRIPHAILKKGSNSEITEHVLKQLKDPDEFMSSLQKLYDEPNSDCFDEVEFSDGRIFERYSIPQRVGDDIIGRVFSFRDVTKHKKMEEQLTRQVTHDTLTSLPNRALLMDRLNQSIRQAKRSQSNVAVLFFNLDRFRFVNNSYGHATGDSLLQVVAKKLNSCLREGDTLARWGGDEFVMILSSIGNKSNVIPIIKDCLTALKKAICIDEHTISMSSSIGVSFFPRDGADASTLLKNADSAASFAKSVGRNNFQFYTLEMNRRAVVKLELENDLRKALDHDQFVLHYQPLVDFRTGQIISVEALLRWQHPVHGLIPPLDFIPLAEETGLILPIGDWVLRTACQQNKQWQDEGLPLVKMVVNVAGLQFRQKDVVKNIESSIDWSGLDPKYLDLELTESTVLENTPVFLSVLRGLKDLGVGLVIDDFGTGYSSLSYLKHFPIDKIKIDRSFVKDILINEDSGAIVRAIIAMAQQLKLRVVAEGVETYEQWAFLQDNDCDEMQGYYFSRPLASDACTRLLSSASSSLANS